MSGQAILDQKTCQTSDDGHGQTSDDGHDPNADGHGQTSDDELFPDPLTLGEEWLFLSALSAMYSVFGHGRRTDEDKSDQLALFASDLSDPGKNNGIPVAELVQNKNVEGVNLTKLGLLYDFGAHERVVDKVKAQQLYRYAMRVGDCEAFYRVGLFHFDCNTWADDATAFKLFKEAGNAGHADSLYAVGLMYSQGRGSKRSEKIAYKWYKRAVRHGCQAATEQLEIQTRADFVWE